MTEEGKSQEGNFSSLAVTLRLFDPPLLEIAATGGSEDPMRPRRQHFENRAAAWGWGVGVSGFTPRCSASWRNPTPRSALAPRRAWPFLLALEGLRPWAFLEEAPALPRLLKIPGPLPLPRRTPENFLLFLPPCPSGARPSSCSGGSSWCPQRVCWILWGPGGHLRAASGGLAGLRQGSVARLRGCSQRFGAELPGFPSKIFTDPSIPHPESARFSVVYWVPGPELQSSSGLVFFFSLVTSL